MPEPTSAADLATLHALLDDGAAFSAEYGGGLANHLPMLLHALHSLGAAPEPAPVVEAAKPEPKPVAKPAAPKPVKPKQEESKAKTVVVPVPMETPVAAPAKTKFSDPDVIESEAAADARMREALQQKMSELNKKPAVAVESPAPVAKSQPKAVVAPAKPVAPVAPVVPAATVVVAAPKPTQIEVPVSSPLPVTKQGRLAELLRRYKADEMTAQDYHSQRAAILAESAAK